MGKTVWHGQHEIEPGSPVHKRLVEEGVQFTKDPVEFVDATSTDDGSGGGTPDLEDLTRPQLNELAAEKGVEEPDKLPNKGAVIDAIKAADAEDANADGGTLGD